VSPEAILLALLFLLAATLYSSVGHAGASAYLAAMALVGLTPEVMRPTALVLNLLVASIVVWRFARAGHLPWRQLLPLVVASVPAAFVGGLIQLPGVVYRPLVAAILLVAAWRLASVRFGPDDDASACAGGGRARSGWRHRPARRSHRHRWRDLPDPAARLRSLGAGAPGGGPVRRVHPRQLGGGARRRSDRRGRAAGRAAPVGRRGRAGGLVGTYIGAARYSVLGMRRALAVVLVAAAAKLVFLP
jgi:uncharacterized protein